MSFLILSIIGIVVFIILLVGILLIVLLSSSNSTEGVGTEVNDTTDTNILEGSTENISFSTMQNIVKGALGQNVGIITLDSEYRVLQLSAIQKFLASDPTDLYPYVAESIDCDDFARILQGEVLKSVVKFHQGSSGPGICFGVVYGDISLDGVSSPQGHAMNLAIIEDNKLILIEPQTDEIFEPNSLSTYWVVIM